MSNNCLYYDFRDGKPVCGKGICLTRLGEPTLEEVKKEWEALGYKFKVDHFPDAIIIRGFSYDKCDNIIYLFLKHREFSYGEYSRFSVQEHQLLTKTFRVLGWIE